MKKFLGLAFLILVGTVGWRIGNNLSSDAVSMALGVFFGVLAGLPAALLVLASDRRQLAVRGSHAYGLAQQSPVPQPPVPHPPVPHPPVIVLNGPGGMLPTAAQGRQSAQGYPSDYFAPQYHDPQFLHQQHEFATAGSPQTGRPARRFKVVGEQEEWLEEW